MSDLMASEIFCKLRAVRHVLPDQFPEKLRK